jgi:hypothetical protein
MLRSARSTASGARAGGAGGALGGSAGHAAGGGGLSGGSDVLHPNLGMHNAAATGDVGLVKFALDNGQPHTSVLNGVLPLHAACSGGSEAVVRLLLQHGADANAPRLRRKGSHVGPGTEGSTPLHFAAANGHLSIVRVLLEQGARPGAADKDGLLAEALAAANGHAACVALLRSWTASYGPNGLGHAGSSSGPGTAQAASTGAPSPSGSSSSAQTTRGGASGGLRPQRSFEQLSSAAAGVKASLISRRNQAIAKVSSNPNLKQLAVGSPDRTPPPSLPTTLSQRNQLQQWPSTPSVETAKARSPSPVNSAEAEELGFASSMTLPSASPLPPYLSRENKRRPSLPSIFEKAAHPAASIRAALGVSSNNHGSSDPMEELSESRERSYMVPPSPGRLAQRIPTKRSLSNILRKATGGSTSADAPPPPGASFTSMQSSTRSYGRPDESPMGMPPAADSSPHLASLPSLPSLDQQSRLASAPPSQTSFSSSPGRPGDASLEQWPLTPLRASASSSPAQQAGRLRSSSNKNPQRPSLSTLVPDGPSRRGSGDRNTPTGVLSDSSSGTKTGSSGATSVVQSSATSSSTHGYRPRKSSNLSTSTSPAATRRSEDKQLGDEESGRAADQPGRRRAQSSADGTANGRGAADPPAFVRQAPKSYLDVAVPTDSARSSRTDIASMFEDAQEFLGDAPASEDDAGEHHDRHRLPDRLRNATASRSPGSTRPSLLGAASYSSGEEPSPATANRTISESSGALAGSSDPSSPLARPQPDLGHKVSSSSISGASSSSVSHGASARLRPAEADQASLNVVPRLSPRRRPSGEESPAPVLALTRGSRSGSTTESMLSRPSSSSLRSLGMPASAAEQAQAILRQASTIKVETESDDASSAGLVAMLAAYGEALAQERKASSSAATASPKMLVDNVRRQSSLASLNGRQQLPSVSEDLAQPHTSISSTIRTPPPAALSTIAAKRSPANNTPPSSPGFGARSKSDSATQLTASLSPSSANRSRAASNEESSGRDFSKPFAPDVNRAQTFAGRGARVAAGKGDLGALFLGMWSHRAASLAT